MADEKIVLAKLDLDTKGLVKATKETIDILRKLEKQLNALKKAGAAASSEYKNLESQFKLFLKVLNQQEQALSALNENSKELNKSQKQLTETASKNAKAHQELSDELSGMAKNAKKAADRIQDVSTSTDAATKKINGLSGSLDNLSDNLNDTKDDLEDFKDVLDTVNDELGKLNKLTGEADKETSKHGKTFNDYKKQLTDAFDDINIFNGGLGNFITKAQEAGGVGPLVKSSFNGMAQGLMGMTRSAMAFIATPIGAAITALVGISEGIKALWDYNSGLTEMNKQLKELGVSKEEISGVRSEIEATAETYGKDFNDIAQKAKTLSDSFGISMSEANGVIAQGLATGNEQFIDSIAQLSPAFTEAGYSAQELVNVVNTGYDLGVYTEQLPEALATAGTALQEQSNEMRGALTDAFGATFSNNLLSKVKTGEISVKTALQNIADKSKTSGLSQQQSLNLTTQLFGKMGAEAGSAGKLLDSLGTTSKKALSSSAQASDDLRKANEKLNKAQADLFEIDGLGTVWTKIKTAALDALGSLLEYLADIKNNLQPVIDLIGVIFVQVWNNLKTTVSLFFSFFSSGFKIISNTVGTIVKVVTKLLKGDFMGAFDAVRDGVTNMVNTIKDTFNSMKNTVIEFLESILETASPVLRALGVDVDRVKGKLESWKSKKVVIETEIKTTQTGTPPKPKGNGDGNAATGTGKGEEDDAKGEGNRVIAVNEAIIASEKKRTTFDKAQAAERQKLLDESIQKQNEYTASYITASGEKSKMLEAEISKIEQVKNTAIAAAQAEFKASGKKAADLQKLDSAVAEAKKNFMASQAAFVSDHALQELNDYINANTVKHENDIFFSKEKFNAEVASLDGIAQKRRDYEAVRLQEGVISQQQYNEAITAIDNENRVAKEGLQTEQKEAEDKKKAIDEENRRLANTENTDYNLKAQLDELAIRKQQEVEAAKATGADLNLIDEKYAKEEKDIRKEVMDNKLQLASTTLSSLSSIMGKESAAGRAMAIAQATIDTYKSAVAAYSSMSVIPVVGPGLGIAAAAAAVASGLQTVKKIASTKKPETPKAEKGALFNIGGKRHSEGGTLFTGADGTQFEAEKGELIGVMNRNAAQHFMAFNNAFPAGGSAAPNYFANGGIVSRSIAQPGLDTDELASKIADANSRMPAPVVAVKDIVTESNSYVRIRQDADF